MSKVIKIKVKKQEPVPTKTNTLEKNYKTVKKQEQAAPKVNAWGRPLSQKEREAEMIKELKKKGPMLPS